MSCPDANTIGAYIDGLLSDERGADVERHVDDCGECRRVVAALAGDLMAPSSSDHGRLLPPRRSSDRLGPSNGHQDPWAAWQRLTLSGTDRFELIKPLGSGAMGVVYEVFDRQSGDRVALKTLKSQSPHALYRFKREFRLVAETRHPNLVTLFELVQQGDLWFFTMELVEGVDLMTWVQADRRRLRPALVQLCRGLNALHSAGAIHRDIKPSNVLVTSQGRVVVLDFGLVTKVSLDTESADGGIAGTVVYMSPEQAAERPATPASDWYAVGTIMYQALAGRLPYLGHTLRVLTEKQKFDPKPPWATGADAESADPDLVDLCMRLLLRDPSGRPGGPEILSRLGQFEPANRLCAPSLTSPHFVGRKRELETLQSMFSKVLRQRTPRLVRISGSSGIGKTALANRFLTDVVTQDVRPWLLRGRCQERESVPYKAFDGLVDELSHRLRTLNAEELMFVLPTDVRRLADVFPVLHRIRVMGSSRFAVTPIAEPSRRRRRCFEAFRVLLGNLARLRPVVLFIDDLQWADHDSLELLEVLAGEPGDLGRLMLLLAFRDEHEERPSNVLRVTAGATGGIDPCDLHLDPLSEEESAELAVLLLGNPLEDCATSRSVVAAAKGSPFFVQEFARLVQSDSGFGGPGCACARGLDGVIAERLGRLPEVAQTLLRLASVAGDSLPKRVLISAAGHQISSSEWREGLSVLLEQNLVRERGPRIVDAVEISHDKIREHVLAGLGSDSVAAHSRRLALAVDEGDADNVDWLAHHWGASGDHRRALEYITRAAETAAEKLAFERAAELYETALEIARDDERQASLGRALGDALSHAGRLGDAGTAYNQASTCADPTTKLTMQQTAALCWLTGGYIPQGLTAIRSVLRELGVPFPEGSKQALRSLLYQRAKLALRGLSFVERAPEEISAATRSRLDALFTVGEGLFSVNLVLAVGFQTRFTLEALDHGDWQSVALALSREAIGRVATSSRRPEKSLHLLDQAEVLARRAGDANTIASIFLCRGGISFYCGDWRACVNTETRVENKWLPLCQGAQHLRSAARWFRCFANARLGNFGALSEEMELYLAEADRAGDRFGAGILRTTCNIAWLAQGDVERAKQELTGVLETFPEGTYLIPQFAHAAALWDQLVYSGQGSAACSLAEGELARLKRSQLIRNSIVRGMFHQSLGRANLLAAASCADGKTKRRWLGVASRHARALRKERLQHTSAWGELIEVGVYWQLGKLTRDRVAALLDGVIAQLDVADCGAMAAAASRKKGELVGGPAGAELVAEADSWLSVQSVRNPARFASFLAPGFSERHQIA